MPHIRTLSQIQLLKSPHYTFNIEQNRTEEPEKADDIVEDADAKNVLDRLVRDIGTRVEAMKLQDPTDTNCSSDSDNQSIISVSESNSSKSIPDEFVVVPIPDCFKIEQDPSVVGTEQDIECAEVNSAKVEAVADPDGYDNNNNSEEADQNRSANVSENEEDDASSNDGSQKSDIVIVSLPSEEDEADA
ncbi:hypothetical protein NQ318_003216, partial [Aromia moschata]